MSAFLTSSSEMRRAFPMIRESREAISFGVLRNMGHRSRPYRLAGHLVRPPGATHWNGRWRTGIAPSRST